MSEPIKQCPGCKRPLPATPSNFYTDQGTGALRNKCRDCTNKAKRESRAKQTQRRQAHTNEQGLKLLPPPHVEESVQEGPPRGVFLRPYATTVVLGDIHFPWHHEAALQQALALIKTIRPEYVVQEGDLYDQYSFSKYPRSINLMTPEAELLMARGQAEEMWKKVQENAPGAKCFQLWGNHDSRAMRRTLDHLPEAEGFVARGMRDLMSFPGVTLIEDGATELVIDGILYTHTPLSRPGATMNELGRSCVVGHTHVGGVTTKGYEGNITWELNAGWLGNRRAPCFSYHSRRRAHRTTLGIGVVDAFGPRFLPFEEEWLP